VPSIFSHAIAGLCLGACIVRPDTPRALLAVGAACAVVPDLDVAGLSLGIGLDQPLGHRGLSHSVVFAAALASVLTWAVGRWWDVRPGMRLGTRLGAGRVWLYLFASTTSHGLLDAMTNGGRGVAFFAPFSDRRYHFPFRPIEVSPLSISEFFTERGLSIIANELVWVWVPSFLLAAIALWWRARHRPAEAGPSWSNS
jgi:inner membrane protein